MSTTEQTRQRRSPNVAIAISLAIHLSILAALVGVPYLSVKRDFPGPGEDVQVWLAEPTGSIGAGPRHGAFKSYRRQKTAENKSSTLETPSTDTLTLKKERTDGETEFRPREGGTGGLGGPGAHLGSGGDKLLARIWSRINSSKYYPSAARRRGVTGAPKVTFSISQNGDVEGVRLVTSCGKRILDDAAIETVRRAAPLPYYPKPITVAVKYSLTR